VGNRYGGRWVVSGCKTVLPMGAGVFCEKYRGELSSLERERVIVVIVYRFPPPFVHNPLLYQRTDEPLPSSILSLPDVHWKQRTWDADETNVDYMLGGHAHTRDRSIYIHTYIDTYIQTQAQTMTYIDLTGSEICSAQNSASFVHTSCASLTPAFPLVSLYPTYATNGTAMAATYQLRTSGDGGCSRSSRRRRWTFM